MSVRLDDLDRKILVQIQEDASQSLDEIARKVGSSKTPVWNRIRRMRELGTPVPADFSRLKTPASKPAAPTGKDVVLRRRTPLTHTSTAPVGRTMR